MHLLWALKNGELLEEQSMEVASEDGKNLLGVKTQIQDITFRVEIGHES